MTSSTCRHGAIHLRQAIKAMQPNAAQIRTITNQATAFHSRLNTFRSKAGAKTFAISNHFVRVLVRHSSLLRQLWSAGRSRAAFGPTPLLFAEPIPESAHGLDRIAGFPEFFSQTPYMRVHGAGVDHGFVTPDVVEQFIAV